MAIDIVPPERLFDHQQLEVVKTSQQVEIIERICGVSIDGKANVRKRFAYGGNVAKIPAGFDFDLDALISGGDFRSDFFEQPFGRILQAERDATRNFFQRSTEQPGERYTTLLRFDVPEGIFNSGARHFMTADTCEMATSFRSG